MSQPFWKKLLFGLVPLALLLLTAEVAVRVHRGELFENYRLLRLEQARRGYPAEKDARLGYVPKASYAGSDNFWGTRVTIDDRGFRSNGASPPPPGATIVAVGDSFTFGDQVDDDQTWPAQLERIVARPVLNGGVFGYSFTQSALRAEEILERVPADWLIVSFIAGDIGRSEFSKRYTWNPWFDVADGELVLHNSPVVEEEPEPGERRARQFKNALGYSALLDSLLARAAEGWWFINEKWVRALPPGKGVEIGVKLVDRLADKCRDRGCRLLLVQQGAASDAGAATVLEHARASGVPVLDLVERFLDQERAEPGLRERYFDGHMTAEGNRWAAELIAAELRVLESSQLLGPRSIASRSLSASEPKPPAVDRS